MRNKLKLKNIIALLLIVFLIIPCATTVYADDKELIDNYNPTDAELKAWSGTNSLPVDSGAVSDITKNYKNAIPTLAESVDKSVEDFLKLSKEDKIKAIKQGKTNVGTEITKEDLFTKICHVHICQGDDSCVADSLSAIAQNSHCLDASAQKSDGCHYDETLPCTLDVFMHNNGDESWRAADTKDLPGISEEYGGGTVLIGTDKKLFANMNEKEFVECCKKLWAEGCWVGVAVRYKIGGELGVYGDEEYTLDKEWDSAWLGKYFRGYGGNWCSSPFSNLGDGFHPNAATGTYNGEEVSVGATHWTMLAGVTSDGHAYLLDPVHGWNEKYVGEATNSGECHQPMYVVCWQSDKSSPKKLLNGASVAADPSAGVEAGVISKEDVENGNGIMTIGSNTYYSENDLSSFNKLDEVNVETLFLYDASRENLTQNEAYALTQWEQQRNKMLEENSLTKLIRVSLMFIGIILSVYFILLYLAYWLDRINNIIEIRFLELLTLKKLTVSYDETDCTYGDKGGDKLKTVNHKAILKICIIGEFLATVLITGLVFKFIMWAVGVIGSIVDKIKN